MTTISVDIDLDDYDIKSEIQKKICYKNCLLGSCNEAPINRLEELVNNLYKNIFIYTKNEYTLEKIYNELDNILIDMKKEY